MRLPFFVLDLRDDARDLGVHQWRLRGLMLAGVALVPLAAALGSPGTVGVPLTLLALGFGIWAAARPDSGRPAYVIGGLILLWLDRADDVASGWSLLAAAGILLFHASAAYAAETPPGGNTSPATTRRWALHCLVVFGVTGAVWVVAELLKEVNASGQALVTGVALLGVVATAVVLFRRSAEPDPDT